MSSLLIRRARLVPLAPGESAPKRPVDVRVENGVVVEVAPALVNPGGVVETDAEGRWLIPGLWDHHVHLAQWTLASARLDLGGARSPDEAVRLVAERLEEWPDLPVIGWGHRPGAWHRHPVVSELDALDSDQPVVLISGDAHHGWLNSTALMMLALPLREGVVAEAEWFSAYARLATVLGSDGTGPDAYRRTMDMAAARGVVGLVDFEFSGGHAEWAGRWSEGADLLRLRMATYADGLDAVIEAGLRTGDPLPGCRGLATMGPLKIISDGSLNTRTAWCCTPYAEKSVYGFPCGHPNQTPKELRDLLTLATRHELEVAVHAIGDRAVTEALAAFSETGARGAIEHAQMTTLEDVRRMAELGVRASVQPAHIYDDRDVTDLLWPDRTGRCFPLRWMVDEGVELAMGSDAPVSPLDPWMAIAAAVHRSADERDPWHPEHALTPREALAASVDGQPMPAPGSRGDLVLLDVDPLATYESSAETGRNLREMPVHATWVAGRHVTPEDTLD